VDELADSAQLLNDADGLRRRLADDGYLFFRFFRGLLPAEQVRAAGHAVLAQLRFGGWVDDPPCRFSRARSTPWMRWPTRRSVRPSSAPRSTRFPTY
jgi:hypothetical protein